LIMPNWFGNKSAPPNGGALFTPYSYKTPIFLYNKYIMIPIIIATLAPIVNSIQLFPQLYKTFITKRVKDLSLFSLSLILITNLLWLLHGYFILDISLMVAGLISMVINVALLTLYFIYRKRR